MSLIPALVKKCLITEMPISRFRELVSEAAKQSYITESGLRELIASSLSSFSMETLIDRLIKPEEEDRINEFLEEFSLPYEGRLADLMVKNDILRTLKNLNLPDRIRLKEHLPFQMPPGERILWIFNRIATGKRIAQQSDSTDERHQAYIGITPTKRKTQLKSHEITMEGDLVVTDRNLYFLSNQAPPARLASANLQIDCYDDGISLISGQAKQKIIINLDDSWFAANLLVALNNYFSHARGIDASPSSNNGET